MQSVCIYIQAVFLSLRRIMNSGLSFFSAAGFGNARGFGLLCTNRFTHNFTILLIILPATYRHIGYCVHFGAGSRNFSNGGLAYATTLLAGRSQAHDKQ